MCVCVCVCVCVNNWRTFCTLKNKVFLLAFMFHEETNIHRNFQMQKRFFIVEKGYLDFFKNVFNFKSVYGLWIIQNNLKSVYGVWIKKIIPATFWEG